MKRYIEICVKRVWLLLRWILLAGGMGILLGLVGGLFGKSVTWVTDFRNTHAWMLYLLPLQDTFISPSSAEVPIPISGSVSPGSSLEETVIFTLDITDDAP